jgi:RNA-directed DNA polymerase
MDETEARPSRVPETAIPEGEVRAQWAWTEPSVWTERMLTALEKGVKGGRWFSLIDKVWAEANLAASFEAVRRNKGAAGTDHQTIEMFEGHLEENLRNLSEELRAGTYEPSAVKRVWIAKPGSREKRPLGIPVVRDRVAQTALRNVVEPIFEKDFAEHSYGFRPGRGCKDALRRVDHLLKAGATWVVDADLRSYFDTIPHEKLMERVGEKISDRRVLGLIEAYLRAEVMDGMERWTPERGSPQGAVISPLLSNIYLNPLDHLMAADGYEMVRYADDSVILCRSEDEAKSALRAMQTWVEESGLSLHPEKTRIVDATAPGGFDFLGYHFEKDRKTPRRKSMRKLKDAIRAKTRRTNGTSLEKIISEVNQSLKGWFEYFKHSHRWTFEPIDKWVKQRLRSILRRRTGRRGRSHGWETMRWSTSYFRTRGLVSLVELHAKARQSLNR